MSRDATVEFESLVDAVTRSVNGGRRRRRIMREELLGHLWQACEEERSRGRDESAALQAALRRFGNPQELQRQLQASVPLFERWLNLPFGPKEIAMSIGPRVAGWVMFLVGGAFMLGFGLVLPATAKLAETARSASPAAQVLSAEQTLKVSLVSLVAFALVVMLAGLSIMAFAFITRKRIAQ